MAMLCRIISPMENDTTVDRLAVAVAWRKIIWRAAADDDERIERLEEVCTKLHDGDVVAGKQLASDAIWSPR